MKKIILLISTLIIFSNGLQAKTWEAIGELSFINTNGNTQTQSFGVKGGYDYDWEKTAIRTKGNLTTSKERRTTTAENYFLMEKFEWKFKKPSYLFNLLSWGKNRFSGIDNRTTSGAGYGLRVLESKRHDLIIESGYQQIWEDREAASAESFGSIRLFSSYRFKVSQTAELSQSAEYIKEFDNSDAFRFVSLTSLSSVITSRLSLKLTYEIKYDNDPPLAFIKTDTTGTVSLAWKI